MKTIISLLVLLVATFATSLHSAELPQVLFGPFPLPLKRGYVVPINGSPGTKEGMNSPFPDDVPPQMVVAFEDTRYRPNYAGRYGFFSKNIVRVYDISGLARSPYKTIRQSTELLQRLLKTRPAGVPHKGYPTGKIYDAYGDLPDYPPRNAGHLLQSKVQYADFAWGSGVFYVTQFVQGTGERPVNDSLTYIFQGISKDGNFYVSAEFHITHPALAKRTPIGPRGYPDADAFTENIAVLFPKQPDTAFTPSLRKLRDFMGTWSIDHPDRH